LSAECRVTFHRDDCPSPSHRLAMNGAPPTDTCAALAGKHPVAPGDEGGTLSTTPVATNRPQSSGATRRMVLQVPEGRKIIAHGASHGKTVGSIKLSPVGATEYGIGTRSTAPLGLIVHTRNHHPWLTPWATIRSPLRGSNMTFLSAHAFHPRRAEKRGALPVLPRSSVCLHPSSIADVSVPHPSLRDEWGTLSTTPAATIRPQSPGVTRRMVVKVPEGRKVIAHGASHGDEVGSAQPPKQQQPAKDNQRDLSDPATGRTSDPENRT